MISRADELLIYAIAGVVGLLSGFGAGALVLGEPEPRACTSCRGDVAGPTLAVPPAEPVSSPAPARPAHSRVALTHPAPVLRTGAPPARPAQEAPTSAALTTAASTPTATLTSPPSSEPTPSDMPAPTLPAGSSDVSTSGVLTSGESSP